MGGLMLVLWVIRFFVFTLHESPKYLMGRGRLDEAVAVVHAVAKYNGRETNLTVDQLHDAGLPREETDRPKRDEERDMLHPPDMETSAFAAFRRGLKAYDGSLIRSLFATPKLAISTSLIISVWGMYGSLYTIASNVIDISPPLAIIGLAGPLYNAFIPYYLSTRGAAYGDGSVYITYRNNAILGLVALPAGPFGGWAVELPRVGRKGTLFLFTSEPLNLPS